MHHEGQGKDRESLTHDMASHNELWDPRGDIHWKASFHPWDFVPLLVPGPGQWGLDLDVTEAIKFWPK